MFHVEQSVVRPASTPTEQTGSTVPASLILEGQPVPIGRTTGVW
jgi:hypothetical protein